jgi:hypothetical protein
MGEMRNIYNILGEKSLLKRPSGRPKCRWEDNIKIYHMEIGYEVLDLIYLA